MHTGGAAETRQAEAREKAGGLLRRPFLLQLFRCCCCWLAEVISCIQAQTGLVLPCSQAANAIETLPSHTNCCANRIAPAGHQRLPEIF